MVTTWDKEVTLVCCFWTDLEPARVRTLFYHIPVYLCIPLFTHPSIIFMMLFRVNYNNQHISAPYTSTCISVTRIPNLFMLLSFSFVVKFTCIKIHKSSWLPVFLKVTYALSQLFLPPILPERSTVFIFISPSMD